MVKIDFAEVLKGGRSVRPVGRTLFINWAIKPFTMHAISVFFLGVALAATRYLVQLRDVATGECLATLELDW